MREFLFDAEGNEIGFVEYENQLKDDETISLVVDVNGKYFHHRLEKYKSNEKYSQSRRNPGHPKREVNCPGKEEKRELDRKSKLEYQNASPERKKMLDFNEEFCDMWFSSYKKYKNFWTNLHNSKGEQVGNMEEGLDTW